MTKKTNRQHVRSARAGHGTRRTGALVSAEMVVLLPILTLILFGLIELGILWSANHRVTAAARVGCRVATMPGSTPDEVREAVILALGSANLVEAHQLKMRRGTHSGDPVLLELRVPMTAAAPDMLKTFGFTLEGHDLVAQYVMRRE